MPEIDEFSKIAEDIECEHYCQRRPRGVNLRVRIAQALREVHDRGYREGLQEGRNPKY
jgi:hypothetical protein